MTTQHQLLAAAIECLARAFKGEDVPAHVVQAAVTTLGIFLDGGRALGTE